MKRWLLILTAIMLLMPGSPACAQKTVELGVYSEWRGDNCMYKSARPFFIIRDIYDLERFWQEANADQPMPGIDFDNYMLLVWVPGPTLFDYQPAVVERFVYQNGFYIVVMDMERKNSGGFWRRPFLATLLTNKTGDIHIMRKQIVGVKVEWKPLCTLWDMTSERTRPFAAVKLDKPAEPAKFIEHAPTVAGDSAQTQAAAAAPLQTEAAQAVETPQPISTATTAAASVSTGATRAASRQTAVSARADDNPFASAPAVKTEAKTQTAPQPGKPSFPTFAEDPLFGSEFDIEF